MIQATRRWFRRNRTNLLIGAGVVGVGYLASQYVLTKISEARQRMSDEKIAKENLRRRFEQNQEDCTYTVLALLPTVRDDVVAALPVEEITQQLQQERQERLQRLGTSPSEAASSDFPSAPASTTDDDVRSLASLGDSSSYVHASQVAHSTLNLQQATQAKPRRSKGQLWQDMKIQSVTRALTLLYSMCLLTLLTRIQLNLLGRRTYLSSVVALASPPPDSQQSTISLENRDDDNYDNVYGNDFETNRKYLTFSWWLLHRGSKQIMERVMAAVREVFGPVNIREDVTLERMADLIMQVRRKVEGSTEEERRSMKWLQYLLPSRQEEAFVIRQAGMSDDSESASPAGQPELDPMDDEDLINDSLRRLLDETSDLIDSPTFSYVLTRLLDASFSHLVDYRLATEAFKQPPLGRESRVVEVTENKCKIAHALPFFCKQAHVIGAGSGELDAMAGVAAQEPLGNEYLAAIDQIPDLGAFAAVIYSSNFEYEVPQDAERERRRNNNMSSSGDSPDILPDMSEALRAAADRSLMLDDESQSLVEAQDDADQDPLAASAKTDFEKAWGKAVSVEGADAGEEA